MSRTIPMPFQDRHVNVMVDRFMVLKASYEALGPSPDMAELTRLRHDGACVLLQAPTGIGKTLMACEYMAKVSPMDRVLWFWFAPFTGVLSQAKGSLRRQAPSLVQLDIDADRDVGKLTPGAVFVLSWQTVAARSRESRVVRQTGDVGLAVDDLIVQARDAGFRVGVVVDEAHHGFVRATEAARFFADVLAPDYVLLMTATPRDADAAKFAQQTGYRIGGPEEWASVTRAEGVEAQLLKKSVKAARFIAQNQDDAQLLAFEEVAMSEAAAMHRLIKKSLAEAGAGLVPLMLVQVPNGGEMLERAKRYLVSTLRFPETAVRSHTSDEPDPNLSALADDPQVEVILFKMAIATGFDAPRAFTLAALRGARDASFGIQVVGRIMRVHRLLQGRIDELPPLLHYGYVYLANGEAQEGLLSAAAQINQLPGQLAAASPATVVTIMGGQSSVQVVKPGKSFSLLPDRPVSDTPAHAADPGGSSTSGPAASPLEEGAPAQYMAPVYREQAALFDVLATSPGTSLTEGHETPVDPLHPGLVHGYAQTSSLAQAFQLEAQSPGFSYGLKHSAPQSFLTEKLPALPEDFERRLAQHIDFARVLGDRLKVRSKVKERMTDVFTAGATPEDKDVWATVSPAAIAQRARQIAFQFEDVDRRELLKALQERFREILLNEGHNPPEDEEELTQQLELVLVRNDKLIRDAHKRLRAEQVGTATVHLPVSVSSTVPLEPAVRNVYGIFPDDLSPQERQFADLLDTSEQVLWWHRNPVKKPFSVALYGWAEGVGFFPDFVVGVAERTEGGGVALSEVKGPQLQQYDKAKAGARHVTYGRVYMVGKTGAAGNFRLWRLISESQALVDDGPFEVQRMRYS
ncbi:DEAD/DEAH box helicase family protein [Paraburkholderia sp. BL10I2N1]|uniref:DEAD/DEAH box helicase n=1 Tax=Paraburkholderia sp. BL10I2N1 TaxID=1938796 RepID=UPI0010621B99|nr:DEAD/DEAH box helicase family protein [Paraburkholderia sp. BL10I2N1]TDN58986.1 superfamily II DNA or RNA helicase [Paraburkholderia sp. BL10I2N1]